MKPFMNLLVCFVFIINVSSCQLKLLLYNCVLSFIKIIVWQYLTSVTWSILYSANIIKLDIFYRGPRHPGDRYSVDDHPVIIRQGSHVWIGPAAGIEI